MTNKQPQHKVTVVTQLSVFCSAWRSRDYSSCVLPALSSNEGPSCVNSGNHLFHSHVNYKILWCSAKGGWAATWSKEVSELPTGTGHLLISKYLSSFFITPYNHHLFWDKRSCICIYCNLTLFKYSNCNETRNLSLIFFVYVLYLQYGF